VVFLAQEPSLATPYRAPPNKLNATERYYTPPYFRKQGPDYRLPDPPKLIGQIVGLGANRGQHQPGTANRLGPEYADCRGRPANFTLLAVGGLKCVAPPLPAGGNGKVSNTPDGSASPETKIGRGAREVRKPLGLILARRCGHFATESRLTMIRLSPSPDVPATIASWNEHCRSGLRLVADTCHRMRRTPPTVRRSELRR
jgi:hypothetical protein